MNIELCTEVPGYVVESSRLFAYPTCLADVYNAAIEQICLPEKRIPSVKVTLRVASGNTGSRQFGSLRWKAYKWISELVNESPTLNYSGKFIFDARFDTDMNIAHIIDNVCTPVLFARKLLAEHFGQPIEIHVVLKERVSPLAQQAYDVLGIPTICTDNNVKGEIVNLNPLCGLESIQPQVFDFEFKHYNPVTSERVFIPRRGNRRLINNDEVTQFLEAKGFITYYLEDLSHREKWSILRNAKEVVIVHGAGSANLVFNRVGLNTPEIAGSGVRIVELFSPSYTLGGYRHLGSLLNGRWCGVRGQVTPQVLRYLDFEKAARDSLKSPIKDPFRIDLKSLEMALDYLETNAASTALQNQRSILV